MNRQRAGWLIGAATLGFALMTLLIPTPTHDPVGVQSSVEVALPTPAAAPSGSAPPVAGDHLHRYAIPVPELQGFPPDATPGVLMDLWVSWEPPITRRPRVQKLLAAVRLDAVIPSIDVGSPPTAVFLVTDKAFTDLLFGDRYGALSVSARL